MNRSQFLRNSLAAALLIPSLPALGQDQSMKNEVKAAIQRGLAFLKSKQMENGAWGDPAVSSHHVAITGLALMCYMGDPSRDPSATPPEAKKAIEFLFSTQQPDGGFYTDKTLATYNCSLALTALSLSPLDEKQRLAALKARQFLIGLQGNFDKDGKAETGASDSPYDGGIGYTSKSPYSDLSNTHFALEALYYSKNLMADDPAARDGKELDYDAAIKFVSRCQQLKQTNDQPWVSEDDQNKGGFVYRPGESKADPVKLPDGREALRSYGSMSYAGLLSFIYAEMKMDDPRITAVMSWLKKNYTLAENPGMGAQGLFYYYHTLSKALSLAKVDVLEMADGTKVNWRQELTKELFNKQHSDGSWTNDNGRWLEKDAVLTTTYCLLALQHLYRGL